MTKENETKFSARAWFDLVANANAEREIAEPTKRIKIRISYIDDTTRV